MRSENRSINFTGQEVERLLQEMHAILQNRRIREPREFRELVGLIRQQLDAHPHSDPRTIALQTIRSYLENCSEEQIRKLAWRAALPDTVVSAFLCFCLSGSPLLPPDLADVIQKALEQITDPHLGDRRWEEQFPADPNLFH